MSAFTDPDAGRAVARYLGVTMREVGEPVEGGATVRGESPIGPHLRGPAGTVRSGVLVAMADSVAGLCSGLAVLPGWVVSTNLMLTAGRLDARGPLQLDARVLRAGRNAVVAAVEARDAGRGGARVADGVLTSTVLDPAGGPPVYTRPLVLRAPQPPVDAAPSLPEFFGVHVTGPTRVAVEIAPHLRNPWGILHGGAIGVLVDAAAEHALGPPFDATDVVCHFLRPARIGPVEARAEVLGTRGDGQIVRVAVHDTGADDRLCAVAIVTARPPVDR